VALYQQTALTLDGSSLTIEEVVDVARHHRTVTVPEATLERMREARAVVERVLERGTPSYGVNTGLGAFSRQAVPENELERFAIATVADQTASYGRQLPQDVVRAMMLHRVNSMACAGVGVRTELLLALVDLLNGGVHPVVREFGSVGQSDLYEMADIGKVLIGRGKAEYRGRIYDGAQALGMIGLQPMRLAPKEALAIISSNGLSVGRGSLVLHDVSVLFANLQVAAALSLEGYGANLSILHPAVARARPHRGHVAASHDLNALLEGSPLYGRDGSRNLQDPLSFRCIPQTHGALHDVVSDAWSKLSLELNSASDNPLVVIEEERIVSNGNFDTTVIAFAFDSLRLALTATARMGAERVQKHLWSTFSDLTTYLAADGAAVGGLRAVGRRCAALAAEARDLANPVAVNYSAQLAEGIEDHGSLAPLSVRRTHELVSLCHALVAEELVVAAEAVDLRGAQLGAGTSAAYELVRRHVPRVEDVTTWSPDMPALVELVASGGLAQAVAARGLAPDFTQRPT
jgi:histidine ammonia-lyase